ncbi:cation diffusion facilitator family transporter [Gemmobacter serpentinus]|uniref:cation diffusion facilitator family transporter n=1 Tax=Gemmobacter serpentinus TaxID=2652247 RepID=UPI00124E98F8|nr:cation diffusion facilitator family transporter [Gemmobacter serpentinus]
MDSQTRAKLSAAIASVTVATTLVILKLWALGATGALTIAASLADSAMDLLMSLGAMAALIYAAKPADEDHNFGHSSVEDLTALAQALLVGASGVLIGWAAIARLIAPSPETLRDEGTGIFVMVISMALTVALVWWQGRIARKTGSRVIAADRLHYLGDLIPAAGAILSLIASRQFGIVQVDSIVALVAAGVLAVGAIRIFKGAWDALMDRQAPPEVIEGIATLARNWPGVLGFHDLKTRTAGSRIFVHLHIELDGALTLREAHDIGAGLRRTILLAYPQADVIIHKDVAETAGA